MHVTQCDATSAALPAAEPDHVTPEAFDPQDACEPPSDLRDWLSKFEARNGRPLRVLHIGNIANNAYLNAKFLNVAGVQCDVMCFDYYHMMGCPEWEDVDFDHVPSDQNRPDWTAVNLGGYERPRWFAQGPQELCIDYLLARIHGDTSIADRLWHELGRSNQTRTWRASIKSSRHFVKTLLGRGTDILVSRWFAFKLEVKRWIWALSFPEKISRRLGQIAGRMWRLLARRFVAKDPKEMVEGLEELKGTPVWVKVPILTGIDFVALVVSFVARALLRTFRDRETDNSPYDAVAERTVAEDLVTRFRAAFPDRPDLLSIRDLAPYQALAARWRELFSHYDLVQAYAVDPLYPLIAGARPYICFEHGTLRDFTMGDNPLHRLTALAYREADHVFITNGDCLAFAERLGISSYSPMIHPVDVKQHERADGQTISRLRAKFDADVLLFCPLRHDWSVKGTDVHIRALPLICERVQGRVVLLMSNWGNQLKDSAALARDLGCEADIVWMPPFNREQMVKLTQAADVVLDQMALPHFGATAPQALAAGTPVVMSYRPESTDWIVDEPAPILAAFSPEDVAAAVEQALDPTWRLSFKKNARAWIHQQHSPARLVRDHLTVYRDLMEACQVATAQVQT